VRVSGYCACKPVFAWLHRDYDLMRPIQIAIVTEKPGAKAKLISSKYTQTTDRSGLREVILESRYYGLFKLEKLISVYTLQEHATSLCCKASGHSSKRAMLLLS